MAILAASLEVARIVNWQRIKAIFWDYPKMATGAAIFVCALLVIIFLHAIGVVDIYKVIFNPVY